MSIDLKIEVRGLTTLRKGYAAVTDEVEAMLPILVMQAGQQVVDHARLLFRQPKSGRRRMRKDGSGMMVGSAPGEAPAIDTGMLDRSFTSVMHRYQVTVQPNTPYAADLEDTRPYMGPAAEVAGARFQASILAMIMRTV